MLPKLMLCLFFFMFAFLLSLDLRLTTYRGVIIGFMLKLLFIVLTSTAYAQNGMVIIWPQPQPLQQPQPPKQVSYRYAPSRDQIRRAVIKAQEEAERVAKEIQAERFQRWQASLKIPPEKDDYKKYLANKQAKAEAFADPDAEQMQDFFIEQEGRNDFKKWREWRNSQPEGKKNPTEAEKKLDEEKLQKSIQDALQDKPVKKADPKPKEEEE